MKIFSRKNPNTQAENALPGVFSLFEATNTLVRKEAQLFAGYAAWTIMPALVTFGLSFITLSSFWQSVEENVILVGDILLSIWITACLVLVTFSKTRNEALTEKSIQERIQKAFPTLMYLFALSFFTLILGTYLLIIPGVIAFVWLAFTDVIALEPEKPSFSEAVTTSRALSKGRFFSVLRRLIGGNILFGIMYMVLTILVLGSIFTLAHINPNDLLQNLLQETYQLPAWISLLLTALSLPFLPYSTVYTVMLYEALKKR